MRLKKCARNVPEKEGDCGISYLSQNLNETTLIVRPQSFYLRFGGKQPQDDLSLKIMVEGRAY